MHPVKFLFDEINRDYWGFPADVKKSERKAPHRPKWRLLRLRSERSQAER